MKRFASDMETLSLRASYAAWEPTKELRTQAMATILEDCGKAAEVYADPGYAAKVFVSLVVREFMSQRKATMYRLAG